MSTIYTPNAAAYHSTVTLPSDGDNANSQSVNDGGFKPLADNAAFLKVWSYDIFHDGGTITPTSGLIFAGAGSYTFDAPVDFRSPVSFEDTLTANGATTMTGSVTMTSTVGMTAGATVSGSTFAAESGAVVNGTFTANGNAHFNSNVNANADLNVGADVFAAGKIVAGNLTSAGGVGDIVASRNLISDGHVHAGTDVIADGNITCANGLITGKYGCSVVLGADSNANYAIATVDVVLIPLGAGTLHASRSYSIVSTPTPVDGMVIEFVNFDTTHTITIFGLIETPLGFPLINTSGNARGLRAIWFQGVARLLATEIAP